MSRRPARARWCSSPRPSGIFGEAGHADYSAAKAAIAHGLALSLKNEIVRTAPLARVNVVAPGWTVSPMTEGELTEEAVARVTATMALRKVATAEDVARAIVFLCSPLAAGHVTGQTITVAGGMEGRLLRPARCDESLYDRRSQRPSAPTTIRVIEALSTCRNANGSLPVA